MGRARGKLTPAGRLLLVRRVTVLHWPVSQAVASIQTGHLVLAALAVLGAILFFGPKRKSIFVSFAVEDLSARNSLVGQAKNKRVPFEFADMSLKKPFNRGLVFMNREGASGLPDSTSPKGVDYAEVPCVRGPRRRFVLRRGGITIPAPNRPRSRTWRWTEPQRLPGGASRRRWEWRRFGPASSACPSRGRRKRRIADRRWTEPGRAARPQQSGCLKGRGAVARIVK